MNGDRPLAGNEETAAASDRLARAVRAQHFERAVTPLIFVAALLSIPGAMTDDLTGTALALDAVVWGVFVVEASTKLYLLRADYFRHRWNYLDLSIVLLTAPFYLVPQLASLRLLRFARFFRLVRLGLASTRAAHQARRLFTHRNIHVASGLVAMGVFGAAVIVFLAERDQEYETFGDALWWSVVTLTTVGYGDFAPETALGRLAAVLLMLVGIVFVGTLAGTLASFFIEDEQERAAEIELAAEITALRGEIAALSREIGRLNDRTLEPDR